MAARKKTSRKKPAARKKPASRSKTGAQASRAPRKLPDEEAWRELIETALAKPDPTSQSIAESPPGKPRKAAKKK